PAAIRGAGNAAIQPGRDGYFAASATVPLLETGGDGNRGGGDVHPLGNPHFYLDPVRFAEAAKALAERLATLDAAGAADFRARAAGFAAEIDARLPVWRTRLEATPGVLAYHK